MSKPSQVIVVVEDERQKMLIYRYLKKHGLRTRIESSPSGKGSAENWVQKRFPKEVIAYRVRQAKTATALIVVIDADARTVQERINQLDQTLKDAKKKTVDPKSEKVARLVPKRNIETWILCLNGHEVDEMSDYKNTRGDWTKLIPQAAEGLVQWTRPRAKLPNHCVASLRSGISELNRLEF